MGELVVACMGDVVGAPGRRAFAHAARVLRDARGARAVIVNGENARHGRGLHPEGYRELREGGADVVTLGDHALDDVRLASVLADPREPIAKPCNFAGSAGAKVWAAWEGAGVRLGVVCVLGRLFMKEDRGSPFQAVDDVLARVTAAHPERLFIVEIHAEATSEKIAMAHHCAAKWAGRVVAVLGTHTHVQTNDARLVGGLAAMTDLGMCGGHAGVIGFTTASSMRIFTGQSVGAGGGLEVEEGGAAATGCVIRIDVGGRRAVGIEAVRIETPAEDASGRE